MKPGRCPHKEGSPTGDLRDQVYSDEFSRYWDTKELERKCNAPEKMEVLAVVLDFLETTAVVE